jgi:hypothetical protein
MTCLAVEPAFARRNPLRILKQRMLGPAFGELKDETGDDYVGKRDCEEGAEAFAARALHERESAGKSEVLDTTIGLAGTGRCDLYGGIGVGQEQGGTLVSKAVTARVWIVVSSEVGRQSSSTAKPQDARRSRRRKR